MGIVPRKGLFLVLLAALAATGFAAVPRGWRWTTRYPLRDLTAAASTEQQDRWPASKAIDGDTSEPDGLWQTLRNTPKSAWLELRLKRPRRVQGVNVFHQSNPGFYRSVDYAIACWAGGAWKTVAEVKGNKTKGWRKHPFPAVETSKVRITITQSEHGYRMGLNEVALVLLPEAGRTPAPHLSQPYRCGKVADMGIMTFDVHRPKDTSIELCTRTAPDDGGKPGPWSPWSPKLPRSGARVASPPGEWVQFRAAPHGSGTAEPVLREVAIGSPACVESVDFGGYVAEPGKPLRVAVRFREPMDRRSAVGGELALPGSPPQALEGSRWSDDGRVWRFAPVTLGPAQGLARLVLGGATTPDGALMMHETVPIAVGTKPILARLRQIAEWMMAHEQAAIFVEGYNERTLLGLYEITGQKRYLEHVRKWAHKLLKLQDPAGFWGTGYKTVYLADTGSALGLFINFYKFATPDEKKRIDAALARYVELMLVRGDSTGRPFVHPDGSLGVGFTSYKDGKAQGDLNKPYTISTALTGAEVFAAMHYLYGAERDKQIAVKACHWILDTMVGEKPPHPMAQPGQIPYIIDDWNPGRKNPHYLWKRWPYDTSAYAGEGFIAAWTYLDDPAFRTSLGRRVRPHIDWLLRTQNDDGSWAEKGSGDQQRSHGVVNLLLWHYENIERDPRVANALRRYTTLLLDEPRSRYLQVPGNGIATSLAGRALVEILRPGVDCYRWKHRRH
ncbi:discoidin domain-containing protein [bacterium]|nr:discoidin domain-containing protein [bacterium]